MRNHSRDLRERVVDAAESGEITHVEIVAVFRVSLRTIGDWLKRWREAGSVAPKPHGGGRSRAIIGKDEAAVRDYLAEGSRSTLTSDVARQTRR